MGFTDKEKAAVKALVSCHETGRPIANYSALVVLNDDAGITYGAHQATHKSGSLYKIVKMFCDLSQSATAKGLAPYLKGLNNAAKRYDYAKDGTLKNLLKQAGNEQLMRYAQNKVFDVNYFEPAMTAVLRSGWESALSLAVVYDSMIQGGWTTLRDRVSASTEKEWIKKYVAVRRNWLSSSSKAVVRSSVYRMATFEQLIARNNWDLKAPFVVHGATVTDANLDVWIAADETDAHDHPEPVEDSHPIDVAPEAAEAFVGNTEGIAEDAHDEVQTAVAETPEAEKATDDGVTGDPPKQGEPVPDAPAQEGEAIVGGRPADPPVIVSQTKAEETKGWKTWGTTITGVLTSLGISISAIGSWFWGALTNPESSKFAMALGIIGVIAAVIFGVVYLIIRAVDKARREKQAHEIMLAELSIRSDPSKYNVKIDRRSETRPANQNV